MKNPEPHLGACPTLPGAPPSALSPPGPGTTVAGPTQDQGAWASPLSQLLGRGDGASLHHTCGCSHIPLSIPGKIKRQNCTRAGCSLQKEPPLPRAWEPGVVGKWVVGGEAGSRSFDMGRAQSPEPAGAKGIRPPGGCEGSEPYWRGPGAVKKGFLLTPPPSLVHFSASQCSQASLHQQGSPESKAWFTGRPALNKQGLLLFLDMDGYWFPFPERSGVPSVPLTTDQQQKHYSI